MKVVTPAEHVITWDEFVAKFRKRHIPTGVMNIMTETFLKLKQGGMTVGKYFEEFTNLARYAPYDVDSEEKKKERFTTGLHDVLQCVLVAMTFFAITWWHMHMHLHEVF